jgi:hypothetical protein
VKFHEVQIRQDQVFLTRIGESGKKQTESTDRQSDKPRRENPIPQVSHTSNSFKMRLKPFPNGRGAYLAQTFSPTVNRQNL